MIIGVDASRAFVKDKTGTENYSFELLRAIFDLKASKDHQWRLYVKEGVGVDEKIKDKAEIVVINRERLWTQVGLAWECLKRPPDVLWVPAHTLPIIRQTKVKTVVTIHGLEYEYLPEYFQWNKRWYLNKSTEYAAAKADKIIAVSGWTKKQLVERLGADGGKIEVVYEGVGERFDKALKRRFSKEYLRQVRYKYGLKRDYFLFIGTIQPRKNLVRLIEAFSRADLGGCDLAIGGKKGWMSDEIYQAPVKYRVKERVGFIGRVADADQAAVYKMARAFVYPSLMEGFGLPVLEAMKMGVPVITSDRGALPEVVGKAGILVDPKKTEDLAKAMELVNNNPELRQGLKEKGYLQVKKFSWKKAASETLKVLEY